MKVIENIPGGTTHVWIDAIDTPIFHGINCSAHRLPYYKQVDGEWWVYSVITGWRKSGNSEFWFKTETEEGFFVTIEEYLNGRS